MKIIDKTPFLNEAGEISLLNRAKAAMKYGSSWFAEIEAQKVVIQYLMRALERSGYILLRNAILPGTGATIPMILAGPTGILVLYATSLKGRYRAKGDTWGLIEGAAFRPAPVNLVRLTARMAHAVYLFLQRQGYQSLPLVEGVLLAADPGLNVDSVRPSVRIVMRDALERFAFSLPQGRAVLSSEAVHEIIDRIQNPHPVTGSQSASLPTSQEKIEAASAGTPEPESPVPGFESPATYGMAQPAEEQQQAPFEMPVPLSAGPQNPLIRTTPAAEQMNRSRIKRPSRTRFSGKQWVILLFFSLIEFGVIITFFIILLRNL